MRYRATVIAAFAMMLAFAVAGTSIASAAPAEVLTALQSSEEANEVAEEEAEVRDEAAEVQAEALAVDAGVTPKAKSSAAVARKIARLTRKIRHVRLVKERIRAKRRQLRALPTSARRRHSLLVSTEKLTRQRTRLLRFQNERSSLNGR